jgi:hypothetical protein
MRLKLIACEIFYRELSAAVARSTNVVDVEFLPKGLHDIGQAGMSSRLAEQLAAVDESKYEAVLLGYGLCNNGVVGLAARQLPLIIPRAHDCITLFLGSHQRYMDYFHSHAGVYFKTSGWIERGDGLAQVNPDSIAERSGMLQSYEALAAKYGEDNARFLYEQLCNMTRNYRGLAYIAMGVADDAGYEARVRGDAAARGWDYQRLEGDMRLIQELVDGPWNAERFLVVPPGQQVAASFDDGVIRAVPATCVPAPAQ